ncbi:MAG TPA: transketolase [Anaerolineales bacterium]|nr:transketolase [Anaerolineales bacterium]HRK89658.1 transketolase [Anaerolineales bacterium]
MSISSEKLSKLEETAYLIRRLSVEMITYGKWGHIGGSFSMAEILATLYFHVMNVRPDQPDWEERDRLILSKAHGSPALYAVMAVRGYYPVEKIYTYCELGGFEGHTDMSRTPGLESSGGPLGMGLSVAVGMALGMRFKENARGRVFCILGDGETNEGNVWEAAMSAAHYHLDNLISVVDYNKVMAKGFVWDEMAIEPFAEKWKAFGWDVIEVDGHDVVALVEAFHRARWILPRGKPIVVIAHTVKGKGVEMAEFNYKWHTHAPDPMTADNMLKELARNYGRQELGYSKLNESDAKENFYGGE